MPTIRIEDDVFNGLKSLAEPFTDTPNTVIRWLLEEQGALPKSQAAAINPLAVNENADVAPLTGASNSRPTRLTPQATYEKFLLFVLATHFKGKGDKREVTKAVLALMQSNGLISLADLKRVSTGETRAENKIAWGRNALKERGLISCMSMRGTWELTEKGLKDAEEVKI